jgi:ubiquinone/menaquinone biosynthesis C-methylase UbiE
MIQDVPSPIDLRLMSDAVEWESTANTKRPWRIEFFAAFAAAIRAAPVPVARVLELGSGPGFLAEHLLNALPDISYVALDFSAAMHRLARERLGTLTSRVQFVDRSLRETTWPEGLGSFEAIVTNQTVHELRHKHYARALHAQARELLVPGGSYLVCDHYFGEDGMKNDRLYMTVSEQHEALSDVGFSKVELVLLKGGMVLHRAT